MATAQAEQTLEAGPEQRPASAWSWRNSLRLLGAFAMVQALFWLVFNPIFIKPDTAPVEFEEVTRLAVAQLDEPTAAALEQAQFRTIDPQPSVPMPSGYSAVRVEIELASVPPSGLAMLDQNGGDNSRIFVNGKLLHGEGEMQLPDVTYHALTKQIIRIPPAMLVTGTNRIDTLRVFDLPRLAGNLPSLFGDYERVSQAFGWKNTLLGPGRIVSLAVGCVLALFILVALVRSQRKTLLLWLLLLTVSWAARTHFMLWAEMPIHGFARGLYYALITLFLSACWPILVDEWSGRPIRYFKPAMLAIFAVAAAVIAWLLLAVQGDNSWDRATDLLDQVGMAFMAIMLARMLWHFFTSGDDRHWEGAILLTMGLTVAIFLINIMLWGKNTPYLTMTQPLFLLAFSIAFFNRNFRLFQSSAQINALLKGQLDERTVELREAHTRETALVRQQAHDAERRRIMRDMHDGLGSNLMSMLMMAKRGKASHAVYADGLQQVIDEMRLMIDSIDSVGESLDAALAVFRKRIIPRGRRAGFACHWNMAPDCTLPAYGPRAVLQVFRILQEAFANAIGHSGGDRIEVNIAAADQPGYAVRIAIADNGSGMGDGIVRGRGLGNMRARAEGIGGDVSWDSNCDGTTVELLLPERADLDPDA